MHLLYFHGSSLEAFWSTGKVRFLEALNPGGLFDSVHMVNLDTVASSDIERAEGRVRFTAVGLAGRRPGLLAKLRTWRAALRKLAVGPRPDLVLADDANLLGLSARSVAGRVGVPYAVCVYYDNDLHYRLTGRPALAFLRSRRLESLLERLVFRGAHGVYAGTQGYCDYGLRHGAPPERMRLGAWCVDDVFYKPPPPPHPDSREILFVGRLHPLKYVDDLLDAVRPLPAWVRLDVAGEGPDRARLMARVRDLGLADRVRLLGVVPREDLLARMQGARALVVTQGVNALVESLLSGRPVVAYDHECNGEFIRHGETGLLVRFRDVDRLSTELRAVLEDPTRGDGLGHRARSAIAERCSIPASLEDRRRFFEACLRA